MIDDAEKHAEEDRKLKELVNARNQAENLIHSAEKTVSDLGDKVSAEEKSEIEAKVNELREQLSGEDKESIETKTAALGEVAGKLAERLYQQQAADESVAEPGDQQQTSSKEDVVDAEFEEVKDDKK